MHDLQQPLILAQDVGLADPGTRVRDQRGDVHPRVVGAGQQEGGDDGIVGHPGQHIAQVRRVVFAKRHPHIEFRRHPTQMTGHRLHVGGRPRICAAVRGQNERSHDACSPHSTLAVPCQRPLRGSAPSTGLAVHGAQPIDG